MNSDFQSLFNQLKAMGAEVQVDFNQSRRAIELWAMIPNHPPRRFFPCKAPCACTGDCFKDPYTEPDDLIVLGVA